MSDARDMIKFKNLLTLEEKGEKRNAEGKDYNEINIEEMVNEISNQSNNTTMQDWKLKNK